MSKIWKGLKNPRAAAEYVNTRLLWWLWRRHKVTNIYDRDWDVAIILDACRYDLFESVDWDRPQSVEPIYSVASMTGDWMENTFAEGASDTVYVTSGPFSDQVLDPTQFAILDEVWRYGFDEELGTIPPDIVTDRAIQHGRESKYNRLVIHYMQPHFPSLANPELGEGITPHDDSKWETVWKQYYHGELSYNILWDAYRSNLEIVLEQVEILLDNIEADRVVVTSDHGNAIGQAGRYGHPKDALIPGVRRVPWAVIGTTCDEQTHSPKENNYEKPRICDEKRYDDDTETKEKIAALGYY
jgi:hypothetical protein